MAVKDIALLDLGESTADLDWEQFKPIGEIVPPPPEGIYTVQAPNEFTFDTADVDGVKVLKVIVDPLTVQDPAHAGYQLRFSRISTKKYNKRMSSSAAEYLAAVGVQAQPKLLAEYAQLIQATAGRYLKVTVQWEGYCKDCQQTIEGQAAFNGGTSTNCPGCNQKVYANARVRRWVVNGR